jgi:hypothetical protein
LNDRRKAPISLGQIVRIFANSLKPAFTLVYTVQVNTGGDPESTLLKNCATDPGKFFHLKQAGQMPDTFKQIVRDISKLRVAR